MMKKLDPRSVLIGFLVAVIGFMSLGATNTTFDSITVGEIIMKNDILKFSRWEDNNIIKMSVLELVNTDSVNALIFFGSKGNLLSSLGETDDGSGSVHIFNNKSQETMLFENDDKGNGMIKINDSKGNPTVFIANSIEDRGIITLSNKYQNITVYIASNNEDDGMILLADKYGDGQWGMSGKRK